MTTIAPDILDELADATGTPMQCEGCGQAYLSGSDHICPECHCGAPGLGALNCPIYRGARATLETVEARNAIVRDEPLAAERVEVRDAIDDERVTGYRFADYDPHQVSIYEVGTSVPFRVAVILPPPIFTADGNYYDGVAMEAWALVRAARIVEVLEAELGGAS